MVRRKEAGFTLIEIMLVMAISGLMLTMIFFALQQASASRRDTKRKTDLSHLAMEIESYASNNNGLYPGSLAALPASYIPTDFNDPSSFGAYLGIGGGAGHITYTPGPGGSDCNGAALSSSRQFVLRMELEKGAACQDND